MNPFISVFDETYNHDYSETYFLNVYINADFLAYCIIDSVRKKFIAQRAFSKSDKFFDEQINDDAYLKYKYKKVSVLYHSPHALLIPAPIASDDASEKIFAFTFGNDIKKHGLVNRSINENINCLFSVNENTNTFLSRFSEKIIQHPYEILIRNSLKLSRSSVYVAAEMYEKGIILIAAKNGDLLYCNYFDCSGTSDFAYHITGLYKNLELSCEDVTLNYSGLTDKKDERLNEISRFIKRIEPQTAQTEYLFSYRFNETKPHFFTLVYDAHNEDNKR